MIEKMRVDIYPDAEVEKLDKQRVQAILFSDNNYPKYLKEINDFPAVIYVKGNAKYLNQISLAVVGSRKMTEYGRTVTEEIVSGLAKRGLVIVSGLARGIDTIAHKCTLSSGGNTVAVLGCGLDIIYPSENERLAEEISHNGALVSEYPLGTTPRPEHFPQRNRIMSGMSIGVVIIEAGEKSGALITALHALEQNREVFAIPGNIYSVYSLGSNRLIQQGAKLTMKVEDILEEINLYSSSPTFQTSHQKDDIDVSGIDIRLLKQIAAGYSHIDDIYRTSDLTIEETSSSLALLELKGYIKQIGPMKYIISRSIPNGVIKDKE